MNKEKTKTKKILIVHHNNDLDGIISGVLAHRFSEIYTKKVSEKTDIKLEIRVVGYNYGKDWEVDDWLVPYKDDTLKYDYIQFIDVTPPPIWWDIVQHDVKSGKLLVDIFDHHLYAYNDFMDKYAKLVGDNVTYYFDEFNCGAKIYFETIQKYDFLSKFNNFVTDKSWFKLFFRGTMKTTIIRAFETNTKAKKIVELTDSYDTWKWKEINDFDALALNEYFNQFDYAENLNKTILQFYGIMFHSMYSIEEIIAIGRTIIDYKTQVAQKQKIYVVDVFDECVAVINDKANTYSIDIVKEKHPEVYGVIFYNNIDFIKNKINVSVRGINSLFNCNSFVKELCEGNGGGHRVAAGGSTELHLFVQKLKIYENN